MKCRRAMELIPWYLDDLLPPDKAADLNAHLESCTACLAEVRAEQAVIETLWQTSKSFEPPDILASIKINAARPVRLSLLVSTRWVVAGGVMACMLFALVLLLRTPVQKQVLVKYHPTPPATAIPHPQDSSTAPALAEPPAPTPSAPTASVARRKVPVPAGKVRRPLRRTFSETVAKSVSKPGPMPTTFPAVSAQDDFLVVYVPQRQVTSAALPGFEIDSTVPGTPPGTVESLGSEDSSYSIRMVDEESNEVTRLSVYRKYEPGSIQTVIVDYQVENAEAGPGGIERGLLHDHSPQSGDFTSCANAA